MRSITFEFYPQQISVFDEYKKGTRSIMLGMGSINDKIIDNIVLPYEWELGDPRKGKTYIVEIREKCSVEENNSNIQNVVEEAFNSRVI